MARLLSLLSFIFVAWSTLSSAAPQTPSNLVVDLGYEVYQGYKNSSFNLNVWQGIRYAAPTSEQNRFRRPQPPAVNRNSTIQANVLPQRCPQAPQAPLPANYNYTGSEDCLFLSVYAPSNASNLPVFVWIHGGGYGGGQGNQDIGIITSINNNSFVSVVIQYRLGAFGFLAGDEVQRFGDANAGLLDQHFALQWVQQHITKFGGDPRQVTIAGESAGAGSVMLQGMAYGGTLGTSLFENIIAASPYLPMQYEYNAWQPSQAYYAFAAASECFPGRAYGNTSTTILDCLRSASTDTLQQANAIVSTSGTWGTWAFLPVTDGHFITQRPSQQLPTGKVNGKRVMSGNNAMEGAAFVIPNITTTAAFEAWLALEYPLLTPSDIHKILYEYYPASNVSSSPPYATCGDCDGATAVDVGPVATGPFQRAINLYSETTFVCPSYWLAQAYDPRHGKAAYKYQYSIPAAQHGADLNAEGLRAATPNISPSFVAAFTTMWGNFITANNPSISALLANGNGSLQANDAADWPVFSVDRGWKMMNLNETGGVEYSAHVVAYPVGNATQYEEPGLGNAIRVVDGFGWEGGRGKRCEFWRGVGGRVPE